MSASRITVLLILALTQAAQARVECNANEICYSTEICDALDDAGRGRIGPRISRECDKGRVCCSREIVVLAIGLQLNGTRTMASSRASIDGEDDATPATPTMTTGGYKKCDTNKECVPRVLCNGTINDSGRFLIGPRIDDKSPKDACRSLEKCCAMTDLLQEHPYINASLSFQYDGCGYSQPNGYYFDANGLQAHEAKFGEFPWMTAILGGRSRYLCGGTIISPTAVLTAAHCVEAHTVDTLLARAGDWDSTTDVEPLPHQNRRIGQLYVHEQYDNTTFFNDIALLVLEKPFILQPHVQPLCLPEPESVVQTQRLLQASCYATGWGKLHYGNEKEFEVILKKIELPLVAHDECELRLRKSILGLRFRLRPSFVCAGGPGQDTCTGDGGSPLFCTWPENGGRYTLVGIVSWGIGCEQTWPGVYANVPHLRGWIDAKLAEAKAYDIDLRSENSKTGKAGAGAP